MPTVYRGKSLEWEYGNRLINFDGVTFAYDYSGHRLKKNDIEYRYDNDGRVIKQSNGLQFLYDNTGVAALKYGNVYYFYRKNAQGNIIALIDSSGAVVVRYEYDAWGNHSITGDEVLGNLNPFRYRSYYYDTETGLYFLQTRCYDPELCRFINIDGIEYIDPETINGLNLYAYCGNNPVMRVDPDGNESLPWWAKLLIGIAFIVVGAAITALTAGTGTGFMAAFGAALVTSLKAVAISTAISAGIGFVGGGLSTGTWEGAFNGLKDGAINGFMWGGIFAGGAQILSGGFKVYAQIANHFGKLQVVKKFPVFSPDRLKNASEIIKIAGKGQKFYDYGGTLIRFGKFAHIDVSTKSLLHLAAFGFKHIPIGTIFAGFVGGFYEN